MGLDLDIDDLLVPFDGDFRGGIDLREDDNPNNAYRQIRDARNEAREIERQADLAGDTSVEAIRYWRDVWSNGQSYLKNDAKDLEIVAYMIESAVRLGGITGLAEALQLTTRLIGDFWEELLPLPDEDGIETTLLPISRLNSDVITYPMLRLPITEDTSVGEFVVWQHSQAKQLESMDGEERAQRVDRGAITMETLTRAVVETSDTFYKELIPQIESARTALQTFNSLLQEKAGEEFAPNLSRIEDGLTGYEQCLKSLAGDRFSTDAQADEDSASDDSTSESSSGESSSSNNGGKKPGAIASRDDALELLEKVAIWFERHEPQSILPSEIRKAKRRGRMTPMELYKDLIVDEETRSKLFKDVGIESPSDDSEY